MLLDTFVLNNGLNFEFKKLILIPDILILFRRLKNKKKMPSHGTNTNAIFSNHSNSQLCYYAQ